MKRRRDIILALDRAIYQASLEEKDMVMISSEDARWLMDYLEEPYKTAEIVQQRENCQLFYCTHCSQSFWFPGIEDQEIRKEYGYSVWYATCPTCGEEIRLTDHYWR